MYDVVLFVDGDMIVFLWWCVVVDAVSDAEVVGPLIAVKECPCVFLFFWSSLYDPVEL